MGRAGGRAGPQQVAGRAAAPARPVGTTTGGEQLALQGIVGNQALGALLSGGTPLDAVTRAQMEAGFGRDLGHVRVHTDGAAVRSVESVGARAYTVGRHIFLGAEVLQQGNGFVRQLLAHELAHVVQQERGGAQDPSTAGGIHEEHARRAADAVLTGHRAVDAGQGTRLGPARAEPARPDNSGSLLGSIGQMLGARLLGAVNLPASGVALAAVRGFAGELARQLVKDDKSAGALFLAQVSGMSPEKFGQFAKGYFSGLVEGLASPITDMVGLAAFGEQLQRLGVQFLSSVFAGHPGIAGDLDRLAASARKLVPNWRQAWENAKADPKGTVLALFTVGEQLRAGTETLAYNLGRSGAQSLTESLAEPFRAQAPQEKAEPSLIGTLLQPATSVVSAGRALMDRIQNTPWAKVGGKFGYVVGSLAIQLVLLFFTEGLGNLIEQVAQKIGSLGAALGKLIKPVGTAVTRLAEFLGEVGRGVAAVEELIGRLMGKVLAPLEKILGPVLKPLAEVMQELKVFLRKLFGVAERDGAQLVERAAGAATRPAPRPAPSPTPRPAPHGAPPTGSATASGHPYRPTPSVPDRPRFPLPDEPVRPPIGPVPEPTPVPGAPVPREPVVHPPSRRRIDPGPFKEAPTGPPRRPDFEIDPRFRKSPAPPRRPEVPPPSPRPPEPVKTPVTPPKPPEPLPKPRELPPAKPASSAQPVRAPEPPVAVPAGAEVTGGVPEPARAPALASAGGETAELAEAPAASVKVAEPAAGGGGGGSERVPAPPRRPRPEGPEGPGKRRPAPGAVPPGPHDAEIQALLEEAERLGQSLDAQTLREAAAAKGDRFPEFAAQIREEMSERAEGLAGRAAQVHRQFEEAGEHYGPGHTGPGRPRPEIALPESAQVARSAGLPDAIAADATVMTKADFADVLPSGGTVSSRPAPAARPITRGVGGSRLQNIDVQHDMRLLEEAGATNIRVNQAQVDIEAQLKLGTNRPDVQATLGDRRVHIEYDRAPGDRALEHARRILANDPDAIVILKIVDF